MENISLTRQEIEIGVKRGIEKAVNFKWIEPNKLVNISAVISGIADEVEVIRKNKQKNEAIGQAFTALREYAPELFEAVMAKVNKVT
jgi:hypothetical protein